MITRRRFVVSNITRNLYYLIFLMTIVSPNGPNMKDIVTGAREEDTRPLLRRSITLQSAVIAYF